MTKKWVLFVSGIVSMLLVSINFIGTYKVCSDVFECTELLSGGMLVLFPVIPLFLLSLITYKMPEVVFQSWWRFARIFTPLAMFLILITPAYTHNWMFPVVKGTVAVALSGLFVVISLVQIIFAQRKLKQGTL